MKNKGKKLKIILILSIVILAISYGVFVWKTFRYQQSEFDTSFVKKIELVVNGETYTFQDEEDLNFIKSFIDGQTYYDIAWGKCADIYNPFTLILIGDARRLELYPTGDGCGFYGARPLFYDGSCYYLDVKDFYSLFLFIESETGQKIIPN